MKTKVDEDLRHFTIEPTTREGKAAYMVMSTERYRRIMPPRLSEERTVIKEGNRDEACNLNGHTWGEDRAHLGAMSNGVVAHCLVCWQLSVRKWI